MSSKQQDPKVVYVRERKSMGLAFLLTLLFGPLGMLYTTVAGALIMLILSAVIGVLTAGIGLIITWPISIIWGCAAARR